MSSSENRNFAEMVSQRLRENGWTQKKFAEYIGKDESTVSLWMCGRKTPNVVEKRTVSKLAKFLHTTSGEVQKILSDQKGRAEDGTRKGTKVIKSLRELENALKEEKLLFNQVFPYNTKITAIGIEERLLEQEYDVHESLIGEFLNTRPEFMKVDEGFVRQSIDNEGDPRSQLRSHIRVRSIIRQACAQLNAAFDSAKNNRLLKEDVQNLIAETVRYDEELSREDWHREIQSTLLQALTELRLIEMVPAEEAYRQRWLINPDYVINKLFGHPTGVEGLDFLLNGGLLSPTRTGISVLIEGNPGAGKSMIGLQMAAKIAACGNVSVYFSAEIELDLLVERLAFLGYAVQQRTPIERVARRDAATITVLNWDSIEPDQASHLAKHIDNQGGLLLLVSIPNRKNFYGTKNSVVNNLVSLCRSLQKQKNVHACYVVDSLNAVIEKRDRQYLEKLFNVGRQPMTIGIFLSEKHQESRENLRNYLADIVFHMKEREIFKGSMQRIIEVVKCRTQQHVKGQHSFSLTPGEGVRIYPSVQSLLSLWRRRIRREQSTQVESWKVDKDLDLDRLLNNDLIRGYSILLTGPRGTHKFPLGLTFLSSGVKSEDDHCLVISLREDEAAIYRLIKHYKQLRPLADSLTVLFVPPDYFSAERLVNRIQRALNAIKKDGKGVSRILFSGLNQIRYNSPLYREEPLLIAALIELFKKERVTSMFINNWGEDKIENANLFDMMITAEKLKSYAGQDNDGYDVKLEIPHHGPSNVARYPYRLGIIHSENGESAKIKLGAAITPTRAFG